MDLTQAIETPKIRKNVDLINAFSGCPMGKPLDDCPFCTYYELNNEMKQILQIEKNTEQEELVAEMGPAYLCCLTGIQNATIDNSAAYINSWIGKFKEDKKMLLTASSMAQKAVDYILEHRTEPDGLASLQRFGELAKADYPSPFYFKNYRNGN